MRTWWALLLAITCMANTGAIFFLNRRINLLNERLLSRPRR